MLHMKQIIHILVISVSLTANLFSFDNNKEGAVISLGIGGAITTTKFTSGYDGWKTGRADLAGGVATSFKIGYGVNDKLMLYIFRNSSFVHGYSNAPNNEIYGNCITGLGVNYQIEDTDMYLIAGLGQGQLSKLSDADSKASKGLGVMLGVGCELMDHLHFEMTYLGIKVDDDIKITTNSLQATINYYFY